MSVNKTKETADKSTRTDEALLNGDQSTKVTRVGSVNSGASPVVNSNNSSSGGSISYRKSVGIQSSTVKPSGPASTPVAKPPAVASSYEVTYHHPIKAHQDHTKTVVRILVTAVAENFLLL